jgi:phage shock protein E
MKMNRCFILSLFATILLITACMTAKRVTPEVAKQKIAHGATLIDARSADEYSAGHIEGAINIPHSVVSKELAQLGEDKSKEIVVYCKSGRRAGKAQDALLEAGFTNVFNAGGYGDLK